MNKWKTHSCIKIVFFQTHFPSHSLFLSSNSTQQNATAQIRSSRDSGMHKILKNYTQHFSGSCALLLQTTHAIYPVNYYTAGTRTLKIVIKLIQMIIKTVI